MLARSRPPGRARGPRRLPPAFAPRGGARLTVCRSPPIMRPNAGPGSRDAARLGAPRAGATPKGAVHEEDHLAARGDGSARRSRPGGDAQGHGRHGQDHRRHHLAGSRRVVRVLGQRGDRQHLRAAHHLRPEGRQQAQGRAGRELVGRRRRQDLHVQDAEGHQVPLGQPGDRAGRRLLAPAGGDHEQDARVHPHPVRLHQGEREGEDPGDRRPDAGHRDGRAGGADLLLLLPDRRHRRDRGHEDGPGAREGRRLRERVAQDELGRLRAVQARELEGEGVVHARALGRVLGHEGADAARGRPPRAGSRRPSASFSRRATSTTRGTSARTSWTPFAATRTSSSSRRRRARSSTSA